MLFHKIWNFYREGFKNQTWGRPLIWLVILKFFILFAVLRVFFFRPALAGKTDAEKSEAVGRQLTRPHNNNTNTLNLKLNGFSNLVPSPVRHDGRLPLAFRPADVGPGAHHGHHGDLIRRQKR